MIDDLKFRLGSSSGFSQRSKCARGDSELVTEDKKKLLPAYQRPSRDEGKKHDGFQNEAIHPGINVPDAAHCDAGRIGRSCMGSVLLCPWR
jgi:hypothetical protein